MREARRLRRKTPRERTGPRPTLTRRTPREEEQAMAVTEGTTIRALIGGRWVNGSGEPLELRSVWAGRTTATLERCTAQDVDRAVAAARDAQRGWAELSLVERVE